MGVEGSCSGFPRSPRAARQMRCSDLPRPWQRRRTSVRTLTLADLKRRSQLLQALGSEGIYDRSQHALGDAEVRLGDLLERGPHHRLRRSLLEVVEELANG